MSESAPHNPEAYPEERLLCSDAMTTSASVHDPSAQYPELARTHGALNTQRFLHNGDKQSWEELTALQTGSQRLSPPTYYELNQLSHEAMPTQASYVAMEYINTIHDACKNPVIMQALGLQPGEDSHDEGLRRLFFPEHEAARSLYLPSYDGFDESQQELIHGVLTANFNFIRFVQSQASEEEIQSLSTMPRHILLAAIIHGIHDLGGAMGHKNEHASLTLDEPAAVRLLDAAYALTKTAAELALPEDTPITPPVQQAAYIRLRMARLGIAPTDDSWASHAELLTKVTVADLLRSYAADDFATPQAAFNRLHPVQKIAWSNIHMLPLYVPDSSERFKGQGTEYAPAFLRALGKDEESLYVALSYFAQIHSITNALTILESPPDTAGFPVESPYTIVNFYPLANWFADNAAAVKAARSVVVALTTNGNTITLHPALEGNSAAWPYRHQLIHPDEYFRDGTI